MADRKSEADGAAEILHIERIFLELESIGELLDNIGEVIERVREFSGGGCVAVTEARIVRGDDVVLIAETLYQLAKHEGRSGKAMQQQHCRRVQPTCLAIE